MNLFTLTGEILLRGTDEAKRDITDVTSTTEKSESRMVSAFKKIGVAVAGAFAVDKIKDFGVSLVEASASVSAESSSFAQIMGDYADEAKAKLDEVGKQTGVISTRLTSHMTSLTAKFKGLGFGVEEATNLASEGLLLASDAAAFWDKSLDDSMSALNSFINGSYEGGEAIGLFANDTQMAQWAIKNSIIDSTKEWANLDEATKQATRLEYAQEMMALSGATGQMAKESGQYANTQGNLNEKWRQFKAEIGEPLLQNIVIPAMNLLSTTVDKLSEKWKQLNQWISDNKETIDKWIDVLIIAGTMIGAYVLVAGTMSILKTVGTWIKSVTTAQAGLNAVMKANPIGLVITLLTGLVVAFIKAYNESETFRNIVNSVAKAIADAWNSTVEWFKHLPETFKNIWDGVKNFTVESWGKIKTSVLNIAISLVDGMKSKFMAFKTSLSDIWTSIKTFTINILNTIKDSSFNMVLSLVEGIKSKFNAFKDNVSEIWMNIKDAIINSIKELPSRMMSIGRNIVEGLWNGIGNAKDWILDKIKGFGSSVLNGIKDFFGIHSPSTVFAEIGGYLVEGLGKGIETSQSVAVDAVEEIGKGTISSFQNAMNGLESWFSSNPVLRRIGEAFGFEFAEGIGESIPEIEESATEAGEIVPEVVAEAVEENADVPKKSFKEIFKSMADTAYQYINKAMDYVSGVGNAIRDFQNQQIENEIQNKEEELDALREATDAKLENAQSEHDEQIELLKDQHEQGLLSDKEYNAKKEALATELSNKTKKIQDEEKAHEEKLARERQTLEKKQFEAKKKNDIAQVWVNFASATMRAFAENFWPVALGITAALGVQAGIQTATISSQQYTPAMAKGGIVDSATQALIGEDGREAVVPLERNTEWVGGLAKAISPAIVTSSQSNSEEVKSLREELMGIRAMLSEYLSQLLMKNTDIVLNGESLAYALAPSIDTNLGDINKLRARGV